MALCRVWNTEEPKQVFPEGSSSSPPLEVGGRKTESLIVCDSVCVDLYEEDHHELSGAERTSSAAVST